MREWEKTEKEGGEGKIQRERGKEESETVGDTGRDKGECFVSY